MRFSTVVAQHLKLIDDGNNASTGYGYTDIADFIISHGANVEQNLEELYRRVAFNIIVGNSDGCEVAVGAGAEESSLIRESQMVMYGVL